MLAHELRNPLAPIALAVEALREQRSASSELAWAEDMIARSVEQLTRLVDDLLDVARITRGKIQLQLERVDLRKVATQAIETSSGLMIARDQTLELSLPDAPLLVNGDAVRLTQILANLLHNAAKYTQRGGCIELSVVRDGADAVLRVRDNGIGIERALLPRIFDLFTQVGGADQRAEGGLGIGLTLAKRLVELHEGSIEARSAGLGLGSEFIARFPALGDVAAEEPLADSQPTSSDHAPLRILVVDDNTDAAESLARVLTLGGHTVRVANAGETALAEAAPFAPAVVLLDIGMPGMDGIEVARRLRRSLPHARPLLVAVTGFGQPADRARTAEAGFDHHLVKPIDIGTLRSLLVDHARAVQPAVRV
jgi:CheY-like chemotaxis protein